MDPPDIFEAVIYIRWPCQRVGRGLSLCRDRASIVARAGFDHHVDNLQPENTQIAPPAAVGWEKIKNKTCSFFFPLSGGTRNFSAVFLKKHI